MSTVTKVDISSIARDLPPPFSFQEQVNTQQQQLGEREVSPGSGLPTYIPPGFPGRPILGHEQTPLLDKQKNEEQESVEKRRIILLLSRYQNDFQEVASPILRNKSLEDMPLSKLKTMLEEVRLGVASKNMSSLNVFGAEALLTVYEKFMVNAGVKCQGISSCARDPAFMDIVKEISLENMNLIYVAPHWRGLFYLLRQTYAIHEATCMMESVQNQRQNQPNISQVNNNNNPPSPGSDTDINDTAFVDLISECD